MSKQSPNNPPSTWVEAAWLLAAVCTPCWVMPFAWSGYEPPKAVVVRALGALAIGGTVLWGLARRDPADRNIWRRVGSHTLVLSALALLGVYALSTGFSLVPGFSIHGAPTRGGGLLTRAGLCGLFLAVALGVRTRAQMNRLLTAISLGGLAVATLTLVQASGLPLLKASMPFGGREASFLGNPIFLGSYIVVAFPIALWMAVSNLAQRHWLRGTTHAVTSGLLILALHASGSRGPILAFAFSLYLGALLSSLVLRRRHLTIGLAVTGLVAMVAILVLIHQHFPNAKATEALARGNASPRLQTVAVRFQAYQTITRRMLSREPIALPDGPYDHVSQWRGVLGYGPQTLGITLDRFFPGTLERLESTSAVIDSGHSRLMEVWAEMGLLGLLAYLMLMALVMHGIFDGLWRSAKHRHMKTLTTCIVITTATAEACLTRWWGLWAWGVAVLLGVIAGFMLYALVSASTRRSRVPLRPARWRLGLHVALGMSTAGFFVETQFGPETVASALLFWLVMGMLVALKVNPELGIPSAGNSTGAADADNRPWLTVIILGALLFTVNLSLLPNPGARGDLLMLLRERWAAGWGWVVLLPFIGGGLIVWEGASGRQRTHACLALGGVLILAAIQCCHLLHTQAELFAPVYTGIEQARTLTAALVRISARPALGLVLLAALPGLVTLFRSKPPCRLLAGLACSVTLLALVITHSFLLPPLRAEVRYSSAKSFAQHAHLAFGPQMIRDAATGGPWDDSYLAEYHRITGERALKAPSPERRDALFAAALQAVQDAIALHPFDARHHERLGTAYQIWSHVTPAGPDHNTRAEAACRAYQQSLALAPNRTSVALKLANLLLLMGRTDPALGTLHASLKRDPTHAALAAQLARIYDVLATNRPDTAAGQALRRRATHFAHRATELAPGFRGPLDIRILQPIIERGTDSEPPADAAPPASRMASPEAPQHDRDTATGDDVLIVLPFLLALFAAWLLTPAMRRLAFRIGFLDCPAGRKAHVKATPLLGGVAVYLAIAIGAGYLHHSWNSSTQTLAMCATVLMITGLLDDRYDLGWKIKLTVQSATAIGLYLAGIRVQIDWLPGWVNVVLSTVWLMGITNAVNFLDNMNGLASGLALVAAGFFALMAMMNQCLDTAIIAAAVAGACLGFLRFNRPRALIFLGDAGSLTLGLLLAGIGLELRFTQNPNWITWMVPILVLGVPIFDMALVCISRLRHGLNPLATPGHDHSSHRLAKILGSRRRAVITLWFAAITCGILGMLVMNASLLTAYVVLGLFLILFVTGLVVAETRYPARYPARKKAHQ